MRMRALYPLLIALPLSGCLTMGGIADHVDPAEAQLVKRITSELCKVNFTYQGKVHKTETVRETFVGVADIHDVGADEGRKASIIVKGATNTMTYNPHTAMVYCGSPSTRFGGFVYYDQVSQILVDLGGNPEIYYRRFNAYKIYTEGENARKKKEAAKRKSPPLDTTFPIHVKWAGIADTLHGSIREIRSGSKGTMAIELPNSLGICAGVYLYTGHNVGTWNVTCPNDLTASGTFKSGKGAHGKGTDNAGRTVTYDIDVGS